jgi:hypothetical protein
VNFDEHTPHDDMMKVLQASLSFPGVFEPIEAFDSLWFGMIYTFNEFVAGSTIYEADVISPIVHCEHLGYSEEDIVIDVILSGHPELKRVDAYYFNAFKVVERTLEMMDYFENMHGVLKATQAHPGVHFRYIVGPTQSIQSRTIPIVSDIDDLI